MKYLLLYTIQQHKEHMVELQNHLIIHTHQKFEYELTVV